MVRPTISLVRDTSPLEGSVEAGSEYAPLPDELEGVVPDAQDDNISFGSILNSVMGMLGGASSGGAAAGESEPSQSGGKRKRVASKAAQITDGTRKMVNGVVSLAGGFAEKLVGPGASPTPFERTFIVEPLVEICEGSKIVSELVGKTNPLLLLGGLALWGMRLATEVYPAAHPQPEQGQPTNAPEYIETVEYYDTGMVSPNGAAPVDIEDVLNRNTRGY